MGEVSMNQLMERSEELFQLIDSANGALNKPVSTVRVNFEEEFSKAAPKVAMRLQQVVNKGRIEEAVIGGALLGAMWLGAAAWDGIANAQARNKAKAALLGYYQELSVKQNMIIEEFNKMSAEYKKCSSQNLSETRRLKQKCNELEAIINKIAQFQKEVTE